jgi:hypothetical protein
VESEARSAADLKAAGGQGIAVQALWIDCNEKEFGDATSVIQHILVHCESKIAELPDGIAFEDVFREATEAEARFLSNSTDASNGPQTQTKCVLTC